MPSPRLLPAVALLLPLFLACARAAPAAPRLARQGTTRQATYPDIPGSYSLLYETDPRCPATITFGEYAEDERRVALLEMSAIVEDSQPCSGSSPMAFVWKPTVDQEGLLVTLGLSGFRDALNANPNADNLIKNNNTQGVFDTGMLVGWHAAPRVCGDLEYLPTTIYFIITEDVQFTLRFQDGLNTNTVTIPAGVKSLFIVSTDNKNCLFADPSTIEASGNPSITTTNEAGESVTNDVVLGSTDTTPPPATTAAPTVAIGAAPPSPDAQPASEAPSTPESATPSTVETPEATTTDTADPVPSIPPQPIDDDASIGESDASGVEASISEVEDEAPTPDKEQNGGDDGDDGNDDGSACFPASATVALEGGSQRRMKDLAIGDRIGDGDGGFSDVVFFTHRETRLVHKFLRVRTASGKALTVSPGHYVYAGGELRAAGALVVGDALEMDGGRISSIVGIEVVKEKGLYNPHTESGQLVVDGFRVSAYTTAVDAPLAHGVLMAPVRLLYRVCRPGAVVLARLFDGGSEQFAGLFPGAEVVPLAG